MGIDAARFELMPTLWWVLLSLAWLNWMQFAWDTIRHTRQCPTPTLQCSVLAHRPEVQWLGLPSWVWGGFYYGALSGLSVITGPYAWMARFGLTTAGILVSIYLVYLLWFRLRTHCIRCYIAHTLNVGFWLLSWGR